MVAMQVFGSILYNGHTKDEFVVERTTAFVDQVCVLICVYVTQC